LTGRYVVTTSLWLSTGTVGFNFKIQSAKSPTYVEQRVEAFIRDYRITLASTAAEVFNEWKSALATKLLEKAKNLVEETAQFWDHIQSGYYDFLQSE
jgi:insulysin